MNAWKLMLLAGFGLLVLAGLSSCGDGDPAEGKRNVVLYTSLNEPTTRAVTDVFERETGIEVAIRSDTERDKTVGLVRRLIEEKSNPRADVFWCSETGNMVRLKLEGILARPDPLPTDAEKIPAQYRDPDGTWFGFAARARVLIVNTEMVARGNYPKSMWDIVEYQGDPRAGIVKPVTGTTLTHMSALFEVLGDETTNSFLERIKEVNLQPGNGRLANLVGEGKLPFGFTDTSDYRLVKNEGKPVDVVYPDQEGIGTLVIPNTVAIIVGGPHPGEARALLEFLLSDRAEEILANHQRGHIPLKPGITHPPEVKLPGEFKTMDVDLNAVGARIGERLLEMHERFN